MGEIRDEIQNNDDSILDLEVNLESLYYLNH